MGADFLSAGAWSEQNGPLDYDAGLAAIDQLNIDDLLAWADEFSPDLQNPDEVRETLRRHVNVLRQDQTDFHVYVASVTSPDGAWTYHYTGGLSDGDDPSAEFRALNDLGGLPKVMRAIGFHVD